MNNENQVLKKLRENEKKQLDLKTKDRLKQRESLKISNIINDKKKFKKIPELLAYLIKEKKSFNIPRDDIASYVFSLLKIMGIDFHVSYKKSYGSLDFDAEVIHNHFTIVSYRQVKLSKIKLYTKELENIGINIESTIENINNAIKSDVKFNHVEIENILSIKDMPVLNIKVFTPIKRSHVSHEEAFNIQPRNPSNLVPNIVWYGTIAFIIYLLYSLV